MSVFKNVLTKKQFRLEIRSKSISIWFQGRIDDFSVLGVTSIHLFLLTLIAENGRSEIVKFHQTCLHGPKVQIQVY